MTTSDGTGANRHWPGFQLLLSALVLCSLLLCSHCSTLTISNGIQLLAALRTTSVDTIWLGQDVTLNGPDWRAQSGFPVNLSRNLTVSGGLGPVVTPSLDLQYLVGRIVLAPGVYVVIANLSLLGSSTHAAPGLEFAVFSFNTTFLFRNVVIRHLSCLPPDVALQGLQSLVRPNRSIIPGSQQVTQEGQFCYYTSITQPPQCNPSVIYVTDLAFRPEMKLGGAASTGGFNIQYLDVHIVCDYYVPSACLAQFPADFCIAQDMAQHFREQAGSRKDSHLRVILPLVLGGAALTLLAAGLLFYRRKRKSKGTEAGSGGKSLDRQDTLEVQRPSHDGSAPAGSHSVPPDVALHIRRASMEETFSSERVEELRQVLMAGSARPDVLDQIVVVDQIGAGNFGKIFRGHWSGIPVAIKTLSFGGNTSSSAEQQRMALMEAAISCSVSHPNVVQTYTYSLVSTTGQRLAARVKPANVGVGDSMFSTGAAYNYLLQTRQMAHSDGSQPATPPAHAAPVSWEVRLVLEFCDHGSLRDALDKGALRSASAALGPPPTEFQSEVTEGNSAGDYVDFLGLLDVAIDICRGMSHLHFKNIIHGDLKARIVLLKSGANSIANSRSSGGPPSGGAPAPSPPAAGVDATSYARLGLVAKVADFGLSRVMEPTATHISNIYQGTLTHMAPELLTEGHLSKAADVYSFGILLWELLTGQHAFQGVPRALLAHRIGADNERPPLPDNCPPALAETISDCWDRCPALRPTFDIVMKQLQALRATLSQDGEHEPQWKYTPHEDRTHDAYDTQPSSIFAGSSVMAGALDGRRSTGPYLIDEDAMGSTISGNLMGTLAAAAAAAARQTPSPKFSMHDAMAAMRRTPSPAPHRNSLDGSTAAPSPRQHAAQSNVHFVPPTGDLSYGAAESGGNPAPDNTGDSMAGDPSFAGMVGNIGAGFASMYVATGSVGSTGSAGAAGSTGAAGSASGTGSTGGGGASAPMRLGAHRLEELIAQAYGSTSSTDGRLASSQQREMHLLQHLEHKRHLAVRRHQSAANLAVIGEGKPVPPPAAMLPRIALAPGLQARMEELVTHLSTASNARLRNSGPEGVYSGPAAVDNLPSQARPPRNTQVEASDL